MEIKYEDELETTVYEFFSDMCKQYSNKSEAVTYAHRGARAIAAYKLASAVENIRAKYFNCESDVNNICTVIKLMLDNAEKSAEFPDLNYIFFPILKEKKIFVWDKTITKNVKAKIKLACNLNADDIAAITKLEVFSTRHNYCIGDITAVTTKKCKDIKGYYNIAHCCGNEVAEFKDYVNMLFKQEIEEHKITWGSNFDYRKVLNILN